MLGAAEMKNFKGGGKYMRHLKFRKVEEIDEKEISRLLRLVAGKSECVE